MLSASDVCDRFSLPRMAAELPLMIINGKLQCVGVQADTVDTVVGLKEFHFAYTVHIVFNNVEMLMGLWRVILYRDRAIERQQFHN